MRAIKEWRLEYARSQDMPAFLVFSNRTLEDLARKAPGTLTELEEVYGLGPQKIEVFGKELLEILHELA
jgi:ATP-dependent DNA helicase RecQ